MSCDCPSSFFQAALNMTDVSIVTDGTEDAVHMFPSVRKGPVDITKAQALLGFKPTPLQQAIDETVSAIFSHTHKLSH
jgi:nucleoside-diphosphate-sugar epimerase